MLCKKTVDFQLYTFIFNPRVQSVVGNILLMLEDCIEIHDEMNVNISQINLCAFFVCLLKPQYQ